MLGCRGEEGVVWVEREGGGGDGVEEEEEEEETVVDVADGYFGCDGGGLDGAVRRWAYISRRISTGMFNRVGGWRFGCDCGCACDSIGGDGETSSSSSSLLSSSSAARLASGICLGWQELGVAPKAPGTDHRLLWIANSNGDPGSADSTSGSVETPARSGCGFSPPVTPIRNKVSSSCSSVMEMLLLCYLEERDCR